MKSFAIKFYAFLAFLFIGMLSLSIHSCKHNDAQAEDRDAMVEFMTLFSDSTAFAIVDFGEVPVLLVSNETYTNGEGEDAALNAIAAQVFTLDEANKIVCLGEIRSQGTLYPISTDGKVLMSAGHRFVNCFDLQSDARSLELVESMQGMVQQPDSVTYSYENRLTNIFENDKDERSFEQMMARFEEAKPVVFQQEIRSMSLWYRGR